MEFCDKHKEELDNKTENGASRMLNALLNIVGTSFPENSLFNGILQIRDHNEMTQFISPGTILHLIYSLDKEGNSTETAPYICLGEYDKKLYFLHHQSLSMEFICYMLAVNKNYEKSYMNIEIEKHDAYMGMIKFGGSFTKALGEALAHADSVNAAIIKEAFKDVWDKHRELFKKSEANKSQDSSPKDSEC